MKRKLIKHGESSLTMSLPREWVKKNSLTKGNEIDVHEEKNNLVVSTEYKYQPKKIVIDLSNKGSAVHRIIGCPYKAGFDEIKFISNSSEEFEILMFYLKDHFPGFEIIDSGKNHVTIKSLFKTDFSDFDRMFRRFFHLLNHMAEEIYQAMEKNDSEWFKRILIIRTEIDNASDFCRRAINLGYALESQRTAPVYTIIEQISKINSKIYTELCLNMSERKNKLPKEIILFFRELISYQRLFFDSYYKFDLDSIAELTRRKENLQKKLEMLFQKAKKEDIKILVLFDRALNMLFYFVTNIIIAHL